METSKHTGQCQHIWGHSNIQGPSKHMGHPNVWGMWTPHSVTKYAFFVLCIYRGHPNIIQTYRGCPNILRAYKHVGGVQTYRRVSKHMGVSTHIGTSKHTGSIQTDRGCVQTYGVHPNIQGYPNLWGHSNI